jgi:chromosome partitioning protein
MVSSRVDYQEAARQGLAVSELHPSGIAAGEMRELWSSVKRRLKKDAAGKAEAKPAAKAEPKKPVKAEAPRAKAEPAKASAKSARKAA